MIQNENKKAGGYVIFLHLKRKEKTFHNFNISLGKQTETWIISVKR